MLRLSLPSAAPREGEALARLGPFEARLAASAGEIEAAQRLRYQAFYVEGCARPDAASLAAGRDLCRFDAVSQHLMVFDGSSLDAQGAPEPVGVYRLLTGDAAEAHFGFYSAAEFDVASLSARHGALRWLELGRSCVKASHRSKRVLEALWRGVWAYARLEKIDVMFGCASFPGVDARRHAGALSFLLAPERGNPAWRVAAKGERAALPEAPATAPSAAELMRALPPLVKGYFRLGATFSPEPVVDRAFGTTDVFAVLPVAEIAARYIEHFTVDEPRPLAA